MNPLSGKLALYVFWSLIETWRIPVERKFLSGCDVAAQRDHSIMNTTATG